MPPINARKLFFSPFILCSSLKILDKLNIPVSITVKNEKELE
jgi:hypothetical protein